MALMITGAVVFAVGAFFGAVMVAVGEQLESLQIKSQVRNRT